MKAKSDMPTIDLSDHNRSEIERILFQHVPEYKVWAFGSRVCGTAKAYSDLDIVIHTDKALSFEKMATIKDAFAESDLTIRVDVVDWAATTASFRKIIESACHVELHHH